MTVNHNYYLDLAFQIAEKNLGSTKLNPSVGSVVVKNDTIISTGVTSINGRPHSEHNALRKIKMSECKECWSRYVYYDVRIPVTECIIYAYS